MVILTVSTWLTGRIEVDFGPEGGSPQSAELNHRAVLLALATIFDSEYMLTDDYRSATQKKESSYKLEENHSAAVFAGGGWLN